jgi:hypothetical protein
MARSGRCLCGKVQYEIDGDMPDTVNCHCHFCRRAHGAPYVTVAWIPLDRLRWLAGEEHLRVFGGPAGERAFCSLCGTRMFNRSGDILSLIVATLDEEPERGPTAHLNLESKSRWHEIRDDLPRHASLPPAIERIIQERGGALTE